MEDLADFYEKQTLYNWTLKSKPRSDSLFHADTQSSGHMHYVFAQLFIYTGQ